MESTVASDVFLYDTETAKPLVQGARLLDGDDPVLRVTELAPVGNTGLRPVEASDLTVSERKACGTCSVSFDERTDQVDHFKSDWHRYNLKQKLKGKDTLTVGSFQSMADSDVSSISATDSDDDTSSDSSSEREVAVSKLVEDAQRNEHRVHLRQHVLLFRSLNDDIISLYTCVLFNTKSAFVSRDEVDRMLETLADSMQWIVILTGAGHFAGAVFCGSKVVEHKTFHRYTVRAKRGSSQSMHDSQGKMAKSAGASLRRYNESALIQDIQSLLHSWSEYLKSSDRIFLRALHQNKKVFFGGKSPPLSKDDARIRMIPFPTRRATFSEVQRVHRLLATVKNRGPNYKLPITQKRQAGGSVEKEFPILSQESNDQVCTSYVESLPKIIVSEAAPVSTEETVENTQNLESNPTKLARRKAKNKAKSPLTKHQRDFTETSLEDEKAAELCQELKDIQNRLYTICKVGHAEKLKAILSEDKLYAPQIEGVQKNETDSFEKETVLNYAHHKSGDTLLHVAAREGHAGVVELLLEGGANPAVTNHLNQVPFLIAKKNVRDSFRRFMAHFPDSFDYVSAKIPGPLTDEMEAARKEREAARKKSQKQARKERTKDKREEEKSLREEEAIKHRFLKLSDREKRALTAERRLVNQKVESKEHVPICSRCWECGLDITGKVPFEYFDYKFCTTKCLRLHRDKTTDKTKR